MRRDALAAPFELGQIRIGRDGEPPWSGRVRVAQTANGAPNMQECNLQRIVNVVYRAEPPIMVRMELDPMTFDYFS